MHKKQNKEVLSSEMDQAHPTGLETSRRCFRKNRPVSQSSESPSKHESASYFSIVNDAVDSNNRGDIHCALGPLFPIEIRKN